VRLVVTADDFGIGLETSRGILDLAARGAVTSTVLLVNSPFAAASVALWNKLGRPVELGWHPALTLDAPLSPPEHVPTLVDASGRFLNLGGLLKRLLRGRVRREELLLELNAQYDHFLELVGSPPPCVNFHHHLHVFPAIGAALRELFAQRNIQPFLRRVVEPRQTLSSITGARMKRLILTRFGARAAAAQQAAGLPGNDQLLGITDPAFVHDPEFFVRWLRRIRGEFVELTCHPGYYDESILGRDATRSDGQLERRAKELELLREPALLAELRRLGAGPTAGRTRLAA
jgi:chitin disaccharide deacetylase